jgi:hypothetical protein
MQKARHEASPFLCLGAGRLRSASATCRRAEPFPSGRRASGRCDASDARRRRSCSRARGEGGREQEFEQFLHGCLSKKAGAAGSPLPLQADRCVRRDCGWVWPSGCCRRRPAAGSGLPAPEGGDLPWLWPSGCAVGRDLRLGMPFGLPAAKAAAGLVARTLAKSAILRIVIFSLLSLEPCWRSAVESGDRPKAPGIIMLCWNSLSRYTG